MVKQSKQQKQQQDDKQGGAIDLGTVATPIVLYGLHALLKDDGKKVMASVTKPMKKLSRGFAKRGGAAEDGDVAVEMDMSVSGAGAEETQEDFSNFQLGGKKPWGKGKKMMKKGGDQQQQDQEQDQQDGGKKKQRKQKGGDQEQDQQDGGKKKQRKSARKQKGGDQDQEQEQQDGGKKKQRKSARKQKGGDAFAALDDYYKMPLEQPAPVVDTTDVSTQDAGVKAAPAAPAIPEVPTVPQAGGKKGKKGGSAALANVLQNMGIGMVNYDQFGNLAGGEQQKGGALEQYTQQLQQLSERLDKMIREGGQGQKKGGKKQKK